MAMNIGLPMLPSDGSAGIFVSINGKLDSAGLSISMEDAQILAEHRAEKLREMERVEFGTPAIVSIAEAVATSAFLSEGGFVHDLTELQDAFYDLRDNLPACVPDEEIVDALRECFDAWGGIEGVASLEPSEIMRFSDDYKQAEDAENAEGYRIADDKGCTYTFNADDWAYDEQVDGWNGERWADGWED